MVCAELDLVALLCERVWCGHYARIVDQDVQAGLARQETFCCGGDAGERGEVEGQVDDFGGVRDGGLDILDSGFCFGGSAGGEVDFRGVMGSEVFDCLFAESSVACVVALGNVLGGGMR